MSKNHKWPLINDNITNSDRKVLSDFILSNERLTNGKKVIEFENIWSKWIGTKRSVMVNSGTSGNYISIAIVKDMKKDVSKSMKETSKKKIVVKKK